MFDGEWDVDFGSIRSCTTEKNGGKFIEARGEDVAHGRAGGGGQGVFIEQIPLAEIEHGNEFRHHRMAAGGDDRDFSRATCAAPLFEDAAECAAHSLVETGDGSGRIQALDLAEKDDTRLSVANVAVGQFDVDGNIFAARDDHAGKVNRALGSTACIGGNNRGVVVFVRRIAGNR